MEKLDLAKYNPTSLKLLGASKIHFIGIGGIGISAIARMMMLEGKEVSGSDRSASLVTDELSKMGAKIFLEQKADNIADDAELIIYTIAVPADNPEFLRAKELGVPMLTYPEALGLISTEKYTIAVSGTHGKTTTTAMLAKIFIDANLDPTVVVGSMLIDRKSNFIAGKGEYFITEACEYKRSFLNLNPKAVIITNIDTDHLDYYKDLADIQSAFVSLVEKIPVDGFLVCDKENPILAPVVRAAKCPVFDYIKLYNIYESKWKMKQPGEHIKKDAAAAFYVARNLGVEGSAITESLENFSGTWRRFEYKGKTEKGALVYDDYAHHPTEIKATLAGARQMVGEGKKLIVAFQPHLYSRTKLLLDDFASAFGDADVVVLPDIYAAREEDDGSINSQILAEKIKVSGVEAKYFSDRNELKTFLANSEENDLVITMGAGDLFKIGEEIINK